MRAEHIAAGQVTVAEAGGVIAGFATLALDADPPELDALFVEPAAMGAGVGTALLARATAEAAQAGVESLLIDSDPFAEPFYLARGAVRIGERRSPSTGASCRSTAARDGLSRLSRRSAGPRTWSVPGSVASRRGAGPRRGP